MKKIALTLLTSLCICINGIAQKSNEKYSNDEILKLSDYIIELEKRDSTHAHFQKKFNEIAEENILMKVYYTHIIDSLYNSFVIKNNTQEKDFNNYSNQKNEITEDDLNVEKEMLAFLKKIQFDVGSYKIEGVLAFKLDIVADILKKFGTTKFEILAFADTTGSSLFNLNLTKKRAWAVKNYLVTKGVSSQRLIAMGLGEEKPEKNMNIADAMRESRRAEIRKYRDQNNLMVIND